MNDFKTSGCNPSYTGDSPYVWIKTENGFVTTDELCDYIRIKTSIYGIWLSQRDYGKTWALTKEELRDE